MPSHHTPPSGVRATLVKMVLRDSVAMALGLVFTRRTGSDAEKSRFRIDGAQRPCLVGLDPGDVVADGPDFPAIETLRAGSAWRNSSCRRRWGTRRPHRSFRPADFRRQDQHVLGQPALVARDVRGDAQREALLPEQRVAAVARTIRPDLARFGEMDDVLLLDCRATERPSAPARAARPPCACRAPRA